MSISVTPVGQIFVLSTSSASPPLLCCPGPPCPQGLPLHSLSIYLHPQHSAPAISPPTSPRTFNSFKVCIIASHTSSSRHPHHTPLPYTLEVLHLAPLSHMLSRSHVAFICHLSMHRLHLFTTSLHLWPCCPCPLHFLYHLNPLIMHLHGLCPMPHPHVLGAWFWLSDQYYLCMVPFI